MDNVSFTFQLVGFQKSSRQPAYLTLAARSHVIITDEPFVEPHLTTVQRLNKCACSTNTPLLTVDSALEVPARLVPSSALRRGASYYKKVTRPDFKRRCSQPYPKLPHEVLQRLQAMEKDLSSSERAEKLHLPKHLFFSVSAALQSQSHSELLTGCTFLDHDVKSQRSHTRGGQIAAKERWRSFITSGGLSKYHKTRNNPLADGGVARISCYLNLGMLSPFQVSRDCGSGGGSGSGGAAGRSKFLDEFEGWRSLSYCYCFHTPQHRISAAQALPSWSYQTLLKHAGDHRGGSGSSSAALPSLERMANGETGQELWDLCQKCLVRTGELHNNLRMTWGKEVLRWTRGPEESYRVLLHLNDHFALDGLSPPSICGILWCLGLFDGPKQETAIYGKVRERSAARVSSRYDMKRLREKCLVRQVASVSHGNSGNRGSLMRAFQRCTSSSQKKVEKEEDEDQSVSERGGTENNDRSGDISSDDKPTVKESLKRKREQGTVRTLDHLFKRQEVQKGQ